MEETDNLSKQKNLIFFIQLKFALKICYRADLDFTVFGSFTYLYHTTVIQG